MINKASLMRRINKATEIPLRDASTCIDLIIESITEAIAKGERIELRGLGTFFVRDVSQKKYPSSFSSQTVVPSHGRIVFRPCQNLRVSAWNKAARPDEQKSKIDFDKVNN